MRLLRWLWRRLRGEPRVTPDPAEAIDAQRRLRMLDLKVNARRK